MNQNFDEKMETSKHDDCTTSDGWTVQTSKPRRLAPQWTLSRQDLGADNAKSRAATHETLISLKTRGCIKTYIFRQYFKFYFYFKSYNFLVVKRFTKEEIMAPRRPPRDVDLSRNVHPEIVSFLALEPVCLITPPTDIEEVSCHTCIIEHLVFYTILL